MSRTTDIYCNECQSKATIKRTERIHSTYSKLYCTCRNPACGHKFVMNLEFSHTTQSSKLTQDGLLSYLIGKLSDDERLKLKEILEAKKSLV
ncbi:ogr/Delta-like zinc finger family protein [[Pasteurella] aerogenes]